MNITKPKESGFTLIELMIAVVIIAIIAAVAVPSYQSSVQNAARKDGMGALMNFAQAMERFYTANNTYVGAGTAGADNSTGAPSIFPTEAPLDSNNKVYDLIIVRADATSYTIQATPKAGQLGDGILELDSTGARRWDEDNNGAFDATDNDWDRG